MESFIFVFILKENVAKKHRLRHIKKYTAIQLCSKLSTLHNSFPYTFVSSYLHQCVNMYPQKFLLKVICSSACYNIAWHVLLQPFFHCDSNYKCFPILQEMRFTNIIRDFSLIESELDCLESLLSRNTLHVLFAQFSDVLLSVLSSHPPYFISQAYTQSRWGSPLGIRVPHIVTAAVLTVCWHFLY